LGPGIGKTFAGLSVAVGVPFHRGSDLKCSQPRARDLFKEKLKKESGLFFFYSEIDVGFSAVMGICIDERE